MEHEKKTIRAIEVLSASGQWARGASKSLAIILGIGLIIPSLLIHIIIDVQGIETADLLRKLEVKQLSEIANPTLHFLSLFGLAIFVWVAITAASYLAIVHLTLEHQLGRSQPSVRAALSRGLRILFPRGLTLIFSLCLLIGVTQFLLIPGVAVAVLITMAPIILVAEHKGSWRSIADALFLRYLRNTNISGWGTFSTLLYLVGLYYIIVIGIILLNGRLLELDKFSNISRQFYLYHFLHQPFGIAYFAIDLVTIVLEQIALAALAVITTTFYVLQIRQRSTK